MEKQKLVIVPGWGGTKQSWQKFTDLASEYFDVTVIELPCFGDEPCPSDVWGVEEYAEFVKKQINQLPNQPMNLLGHSFGGQVATHLVAHNPNLVIKLVLSGAAIYRPKQSVKNMVFLPLAKVGKILFMIPGLRKFDRIAKKILYRAADSPDYNDTSGMKRKVFQKITKQDQSDLLPNISVPTLVVWGTRDTYTPLKYGKRIAARIPNSQLKIFKEGKHGLHIQQPKNLLKSIKHFLSI